MGRKTPASRLAVLTSFPPPRQTTNPYIVSLARALAAEDAVEVTFFTWRSLLVGRVDVFHVHWPELLVRGTGIKRLAKEALLFLALIRLTITGTAIVRTAHNLRPHEAGGRVRNALLRQVDRQTVAWIRLNPVTETPDPPRTTTILHGSYVDWFAGVAPLDPIKGRLLFAGLIRPYKNVNGLLQAFGNLPDDTLTLHVVGQPGTEAVRRELTALASADPRVVLDLRHLPDAELAREIYATELVVLPYTEMHNSGAALLALSLDRPVLTPDGPAPARLAEEVGAGWVLRYSGELDAADLAAAMTAARTARTSGRPDLSRRTWTEAGRRHARVYADAVAAVPPAGVRWRCWWLSSMSGHQIDLRDTSDEVGLAISNQERCGT